MKNDASPPPKRRGLRLAIIAIVMLSLGVGGYHLFWRHHSKRFFAVREGVFYRVAQPTEVGFRRLIKGYGIKTVISVQEQDYRLAKGVIDPGPRDGQKESEYVRSLGATHLQWPMGSETFWPWLTPWQFEEFFKVMDEPANWPVVLHCMGGRHRTGTYGALFRLEYDRWSPERALKEMYSFKFGDPGAVQEMNLRSYAPRPRPDAATFAMLQTVFAPILDTTPGDYDALIRGLRNTQKLEERNRIVEALLSNQIDFSIALSQRLVDSPAEPLAPLAAKAALDCLERKASAADWSMAAAILADFGEPDQQASLKELLAVARREPTPSEQYDAMATGLMNRFTANRLPYLVALMEDTRARASNKSHRYCDVALSRIIAIENQNPMMYLSAPTVANWDAGRAFFREKFTAPGKEVRLSQLVPPGGKNELAEGDGSLVEDLHLKR